MLHLLVDAYNLMHALEDEGKLKSASKSSILSLEDKRFALIKMLQDYQSIREVHISLVFDSSEPSSVIPQRSRSGGINIIFTDQSQSADEHILGLCQNSPGGYVVVSNDREVQGFARENDCIAMSCSEFTGKVFSAASELDYNPYFEDKEDSGPLYPKVSTRKKGSPKKLKKAERRKKNSLKNL
jgi:predicted RNA-binding protein with PIN domain